MVAIITVITPKFRAVVSTLPCFISIIHRHETKKIFLELRTGTFGKCAGEGKWVMGPGKVRENGLSGVKFCDREP